MEHAYFWGPHFHWFWIVPFLFMILMFVFTFRAFRRAANWRRGTGRRTGWQFLGCCIPGQRPMERWRAEPPGKILDQRYASGEITKEQYEQLKRDMESSTSQ